METILIEATNPEESKTIKAFLKALKINFKSSKSLSVESLEIANNVAEGYKEAMEIESGKKKAKSYSNFKEIMDEL